VRIEAIRAQLLQETVESSETSAGLKTSPYAKSPAIQRDAEVTGSVIDKEEHFKAESQPETTWQQNTGPKRTTSALEYKDYNTGRSAVTLASLLCCESHILLNPTSIL
jgi:hypothetical protein